MHNMDMLTVNQVSKSFGPTQIIRDLSFRVKEHSIYGFIGQNGAGKTTTMKMILGLIPVDQGEIYVNQVPVTYGQNKTNQFIGYLPDVPEYYDYMTPVEYLNLCGEITGLSSSYRKKEIPELLDLVGLTKADKRIKGFSRGMKQRLGIAQALLNQPKLLICDEPTSALDPLGRKEILDILVQVKDRTTVIFSTHILSDVERICDEIGLLHQGKLAVQKTMDEIHQMHGNSGLIIEFMSEKDTETFQRIYAGAQRTNKCQLTYAEGKNADVLKAMHLLYENEIRPMRIEIAEPTLESLFMEVVGR